MMRSFKCDFHIHSKFSIDGEYTIDQLLEMASENQITHLALSDHNCMLGIDEFIEKANSYKIQVLPAMELDSIFHNRETHIIAYGIDYHQEQFLHLHETINDLEFDAFGKKIDNLISCFSIPLNKVELLKRCHFENPFQVIYGSLLAHPKAKENIKLLPYLKGGSRFNNGIVNFYWDLCSYGSDCFVEVSYPASEDVIQMIHEAGGIAVLAHPGINFYEREDLLDELLAMGIDGIEAYSSYHNEEENQCFYEYCVTKKVLISGGSDFHGSYKPHIIMGEFGLPDQQILKPFLDKMFPN